MPRYYGESLDIKFGLNEKYKTLEEAMRIREDKFVPNSEDCDFGGTLSEKDYKYAEEIFNDLVTVKHRYGLKEFRQEYLCEPPKSKLDNAMDEVIYILAKRSPEEIKSCLDYMAHKMLDYKDPRDGQWNNPVKENNGN